MLMKTNKNKKGFTLIELIVVVLILVVVARVAVPMISSYADKAKEATTMENLRNLRLAVLTVAAEDPTFGTNLTYPSGEANKKKVTQAIGKVMDLEQIGTGAEPYLSGIEIPMARKWSFNLVTPNSGSGQYLIMYIDTISLKEARKLSVGMGMGEPETKSGIGIRDGIPAYFGSGHLYILLHVF